MPKACPMMNLADESLPDGQLVTRAECANYLRLSLRGWDRMVAKGVAPQPVTMPDVRPRWRLGDIRAMLTPSKVEEDAQEQQTA